MPTLLPRDDDSHPIPALRLRPGGAHRIAAGAASARNAVPFAEGVRVVGLCATGPVHVRTGGPDATATADDHYLPAGVVYDVSLGDARRGRHTHVAVVAAAEDCVLHVSEKE